MMASPLSGKKEAELVTIETPYFTFYLKGEIRECSKVKVTDEDLALYTMWCRDEAKLTIKSVAEEKTDSFLKKALPLFFEQTNYQIIIETQKSHKISFDHDSKLIRDHIDAIGHNGLFAGVINFGNEVGLTELRVLVDGKHYLKLTIEIYPIKLSYKSDYLKLREDVASEVYNLTFDFMRTTYLGADLVQSKKPSLSEFYSIFKNKCEALTRAIDLIIRQPYHELQKLEEIRTYKEGALIGPKGISYLNKHPGQVQCDKGRFVPKKYLHTTKQITTDIYENQFVKYLISQVITRLRSVQKQYLCLARENDPSLVRDFNEAVANLENKLNQSFFSQVSKLEGVRAFSVVMQMSPIYMKFYKLYLTLQMGLSIWSGIFNISNKNIAELYEYWCFIKLGAILKEKHELLLDARQDPFNKDSLFVTLKKGKASTMRFRHRDTGEIFTLAYNKAETTPTVTQKPDNMLSLCKHGKTESFQYVIDAKYRLDYDQKYGIEVPKEEDINTMHRYRDAIVYKNSQQSYTRSVVGAIILFPGSKNEAYRDTRFYRSIQKVNIGGLPFLPSYTEYVRAFLDELVTEMLSNSKEKKVANIEQQIIDYTQIVDDEELLIAEEEGNIYL